MHAVPGLGVGGLERVEANQNSHWLLLLLSQTLPTHVLLLKSVYELAAAAREMLWSFFC